MVAHRRRSLCRAQQLRLLRGQADLARGVRVILLDDPSGNPVELFQRA